jgi:hypothetical protein
MNLRRSCVTCGLALTLAAAPCRAQQSMPQAADNPDSKREKVFVQLAGSDDEIRGRLLHLDSQTLSVEVDNRKADFPLDRVLRIEKKKHDTVLDGALLFAAFLAACARWWCGQGLDSEPSVPRDVFAAAGAGALYGAGIDWLITRRTTIFEAGGSSGALPMPAGVLVRVRF